MSPPGLTVHIEVIAVTEGLAPQFSIYDASSALVQTIGNQSFGLVVESTMTLPQPGLYRIDVSSASNTSGQFVIQLSLGSPLTPAIALALNTQVNGALAANERAIYSFNANPQSAIAVEISTNNTAGLTAALIDANGVVVGMLGSTSTGGRFDLAPGQSAYRLEIANDGTQASLIAYQVALVARTSLLPIIKQTVTPIEVIAPSPTPEPNVAPTFTLTPGVVLPSLPDTGACTLATAEAGTVNIRASASTNAEIIGRMSPLTVYSATGINPERTWYQIAFDEQTGWAAGFVVRTGGDCTTLPVVFPPPVLPAPVTQQPETPQPETPPTLTAAQLARACIAKYGDAVFAIANTVNCYTCPAYYTHTGPGSLTCSLMSFSGATRTGPATGLLRTDCPRGQFWDPNGNCYTCPTNYERNIYPVTDRRACNLVRAFNNYPDNVSIVAVGLP